MRQDYPDSAGKAERIHLPSTRRSDAVVRPVLTASLSVEIMALSHIISCVRSPAAGYKKPMAPFGVLCSGPELWSYWAEHGQMFALAVFVVGPPWKPRTRRDIS